MIGIWAPVETAFWALVVLGVLIFVHELGHFLVARMCQVRVLVFSLGFGPKVWGWQGRESGTEYILSAIPLGGYVKMLGEGEEEGEIPPEERPHAFSAKSVKERFAIVFAGPFSNFLFGIVAAAAAFMIGVPELEPVIGNVTAGSPAMAAGLRMGDRVTHVNGQEVLRWEVMSHAIKSANGEPVALTVEREGKSREMRVTPQIKEAVNLFGEKVRTPLIGVAPAEAVVVVRYGPSEALVKGAVYCWKMVDLTLTSIGKLITGVVSADQIGGPILIADLAGKTAKQGAASLLFFMCLISVNLGILNLLPIPVLDGGHLLFFSIEAIKGTPVSEGTRIIATRVGMTLLAGLMLLAFYNDLARVLTN
ncbi:MAG: RIP metalloprotease RseP [Magnetococcales bacterium]|nr:RIP metalloprotease RseP [Magnetococcales bacterium]